ncbi:MAG: hypothetical protein QOD06_2749 [Candidatus Binatota bacterium]|nr:hypothetical protein [Candidatus Binatota bacterium]
MLADDERLLLAAELTAVLEQVASSPIAAEYAALREAVERGEVPEALERPLEVLLETSLASGRIRRVHLAHGEMAANRLFQRTGRGREIREQLDAVNEGLRGIAGQTLGSVAFAPRTPGSYSLTIETDRARVAIVVGPGGVRVQSIEVGG